MSLELLGLLASPEFLGNRYFLVILEILELPGILNFLAILGPLALPGNLRSPGHPGTLGNPGGLWWRFPPSSTELQRRRSSH